MKKSVFGILAAVSLVGASLLGAGAANATPGLCTSVKVNVNASGTTIKVTNPCGNLAGKYALATSGPTGSWSSTVTLAPNASTSFTNRGTYTVLVK